MTDVVQLSPELRAEFGVDDMDTLPPPSAAPSATEPPSIAQIDTEIARIFNLDGQTLPTAGASSADTTALRALRTRRNTLAPVGRLPADMLRELFLVAARADAFGRARLALSHVCTAWRAVALDLAPLWAHIRNGHDRPAALPALLARSRHAPLYVEFDSARGPLDVAAMKQTSAHLARFQFLKLVGPSQPVHEYLTTLVAPAPILEELVLKWRPVTIREIPMLFLTSFLLGEAPSLRKLELSTSDLSWTSPVFLNLPNLQSLHVHNIGNLQPHGDSHSVLGQCRSLQNLNLSNVLSQKTLESVDMPLLLDLRIYDYKERSISFLQHLNISAIRDINIDVRLSGRHDRPFDPAADMISMIRSIVHPSREHLESFSVEIHVLNAAITILGERHAAPPAHDLGTNFHVTVDTTATTADDLRALATMAQLWSTSLPHLEIRTLKMTHRTTDTLRAYEAALAELPHVRRVVLQGTHCDVFCHALAKPGLFPLLQAAELSGVDFAAVQVRMIGLLFDMTAPRRSFYELLHTALCARRNAQMPLHTLCLRRCAGVTQAMLDALREVVEDVQMLGTVEQNA